MLQYLISINEAAGGPPNPQVHQAAQIIAWHCCLRSTFKPRQVGDKHLVQKALRDANLNEDLLDHLRERLKIIRTVPREERFLQILLDPLAEYLAALHVRTHCAGDDSRWQEFLSEADSKPDAPAAIRGFMTALRVCCVAHGSSVPS